MAKITISRLFDVGQYLSTDAGKELADALRYLSEFVEVTVRALRNNLSIDDNFNATTKEVNIVSGLETVIQSAGSENRAVKQVIIRRVISQDNYIVTSHGWKYDTLGNVVLTVNLNGAPTSSTRVDIAILF